MTAARVALAVVCLLYCLTPIHNGNFFWHLRNGEDILDTGVIRTEDPFTWTAEGCHWLQQEWLSEVLFAASYRVGGEAGPILLKGLAVMAAVLLATGAAGRLGAGWKGVVLVGVAWLALAQGRWVVRPHVLTILMFSLYLYLTARGTGGLLRSLLVFVPLQVVWVNLHAGFMAGWFLLAIPVGGALLERRPREALRRGAVLSGAVLASGLHPNGFESITYLTDFLSRPLFRQTIREWWSPFHPMFDPAHAIAPFAVGLVLVLLATWAVVLLGRRRMDPPRMLGLLLLSAATLTTSRNIDLLAMAAVAWVAPLVPARRIPAAVPIVLLAAAAAVPPVLGVPRGFGPPRSMGLGVDWDIYPDGLADFLEENPALLDLRVLNSNEISGYLEYRFGERLPLYMDGRCHLYPQELYAEYIALTRAPDLSLASYQMEVVSERGFGLALLDHPRSEGSVAYLLATLPGWRAVYWDELTVAYAREPVPPGVPTAGLETVDPLLPGDLLERPLHSLPAPMLESELLPAAGLGWEPAITASSALLLRDSSDCSGYRAGLLPDSSREALLSALAGEPPRSTDPRLLTVRCWALCRQGLAEQALEAAEASGDDALLTSARVLAGLPAEPGSQPPPVVPSGAWGRYADGSASPAESLAVMVSSLAACGRLQESVGSADALLDGPAGAEPWTLCCAGRTLALAGDREGALSALDRALGLSANPYTLTLAGSVLGMLGEHGEAVPLLRSAVEMAPGLDRSRLELAEALWRSGRIAEAAAHYRTLRERGYLPESSALRMRWAEALAGG